MSADEAWRQTIAKAEVLLAEGEAAEDISGIADAVSGFNTALRMAPRADAPLDWAKTQSRLSAALRALGARIDDPVMLHSAMTACDHALEVYRPDTTPEDWARTVALLGAAQVVLGERDSDPAWLNAALNSYHLATRVYTRDAAPSDWARMQRNCGAVLSLQGERTGDTASLREAVDHYRAALGEYAEQDSPIDIAVTQSNLGQALRVLGERDNDRDTLAEAVAACRAALNVYTREATPLEWAMASTNLANALAALNDTASIEELRFIALPSPRSTDQCGFSSVRSHATTSSAPRDGWRSSASPRTTTIDDDMRAGDVAGEIRAQVHHHVRHLLRHRVAACRRVGRIRVVHGLRIGGVPLRLERAHHARLDRPGAHGIHPDAEACDVRGCDFRQTQHPVLRRDIRRHAGTAEQRGSRGGIDDGTAALFQHDRQDVAHTEENTLEVDTDHLVEDRLVVFLCRCGLALDAGVVEEAVDRAIGIQRRLYVVLHVGGFCDVGAN
jgi:tetratricopeptide (TPR) repeat protein